LQNVSLQAPPTSLVLFKSGLHFAVCVIFKITHGHQFLFIYPQLVALSRRRLSEPKTYTALPFQVLSWALAQVKVQFVKMSKYLVDRFKVHPA
jgi:hypothetical protein